LVTFRKYRDYRPGVNKVFIEGNIAAVKRLLKKVLNIQNPDPETGW
jgi:hypothetical protein